MIKKLSILAVGLAIALPSAFASVLSAGGTGSPDTLTLGAGATLEASTSGTITAGTFSANYTEWVYADPTNTFCANCLDFIVQVTNNGRDVNERISSSAFGSFLTDVGVDTTGGLGMSGGKAPVTVNRSANGNVIGFNYNVGAGKELDPGQHTMLLDIETNATHFTSGFVSDQDGTAAFNLGYQPASVPEPFSMSLLGGGLALLGIARWRRSAKKA